MSERHSTSRVSSVQSDTSEAIEFEGYPKEFATDFDEWQRSIPDRNTITPADIAHADEMEHRALEQERQHAMYVAHEASQADIRRRAQHNVNACNLVMSALGMGGGK